MIDPESISNPLERQTDEELIVGFQKGNAAAFDLLVGRYKDPLTNYVFRFLGDWDECSDIVQETFVRVFQNRDSYKPIAKFSTWIYTIARNLRIDRLRRETPYQELPEELLEIPDDNDPPDAALNREQQRERIGKALEALPPEQYQVVHLSYVEGLSHNEIASVLGAPLGTVKSRMRLAYEKVREAIGEET